MSDTSPGRNRRAAPRSLAVIAAIASGGVAAPAPAQTPPGREALFEITLDIDNDGRPDRAVLVDDNDRYVTDLYIYLAVGDEKLDLSRQPAVLKKDVTVGPRQGSLRTLESKENGSLIVKAVQGGSNAIDRTLTIVHRGGEFVVAGYTVGWDTRTSAGGCDINYLTGKGFASKGLAKSRPIRGTFAPVRLADWSTKKHPKACTF